MKLTYSQIYLLESISSLSKDTIIMKVKLSDIINAMEMTDQYSENFLDRITGEIVWISDLAMTSNEQEEAYDRLDEHGFYRLPTSFDIREYDMMEKFIDSLPEPARSRLGRAIQGKGAFQRFKDTAGRLGVAPQWYEFQASEYKKKSIRESAFREDIIVIVPAFSEK